MGNSSQLFFLGTPRYHGSSEVVPLPLGNFLWLLTFLAVQDDWVDRKDLAELLWQDADLQGGLNNLRQLLHRNKNLEWVGVLEVNAQALRISSDTDVRRFRVAFDRGDWQAALQEYGGVLLEGMRLTGVDAFETWLETERSMLQSDWREALIGRVQALEAQGDSSELFGLLEKLLNVDPYNEEALLVLLQQALKTNRQDIGLRQFETFRQRLKTDLGAEPLSETLRLADQLSGRMVARVPSTPKTFFVGRDAEQVLILSQLEQGSVRLLTLRGSGGVGKTTLAQKILELAKPSFPDGTTWVSLQAVSRLEDVPLAMAAALELRLHADSSVWAQITENLRFKNALLILDNLEQLRGVAESLAELLEAATHLKILVTSRVSLELPNESVFVLEGLDYPETANLALMQTSSAVQLFVERAALRRSGFALTEQTMAGILRICKLLHGLPLGLTLAAAWAAELSPDALADGLESNADLPETLESETLGMHRSLKTVFEHSWELLEDDLRSALSSLSVFRGGFERRAALEGLGVSARALLALVGRSLLQSLPGGRYDLHPAVQMFAAQKLETPQLQTLQLAHARYFSHFAEQAEMPLRGGVNQTRMLERVAADHRNFTAVFENSNDPELALKTATALCRYWFLHGHMLEGLTRLETALANYIVQPRDSVLLARAELATGIQGSCSAQFENANEHLNTAQLEAASNGLKLIEAEAIYWRAANQREQGFLRQARENLGYAIKIQQSEGDLWGLGHSINDLGIVYAMEGDNDTAQTHFQNSLELCREREDRKGEAIALENIALVIPQGETAMQLIRQSLAIKRELGDVSGIATSLSNLGNEALNAGLLKQARRDILESTEMFWRMGQPLKTTYNLGVLAEISFLERDYIHALTLYGASWSGFERLKGRPNQEQYVHHNELERQAREVLGEEMAQTAYQRGWAMRLEEAVQFAAREIVTLAGVLIVEHQQV